MWVRLSKKALNSQILKPLCTLDFTLSRNLTSRSEEPQTVLLEKALEEPVIVVSENDDVDIIGPPDAVSNLRPIIRKRLLDETLLQRELREMQDATQMWNQEFWAKHNTKFIKQRQEYVKMKKESGEDRQLTADEMSDFYKKFLDQNWETHLYYNMEWYKRNFSLLYLAFRVNLEKSITRFR